MTMHCPDRDCPGLLRDGLVAEYVDGITRCSECGARLMRGPAPVDPPEPPGFTAYETVHLSRDPIEAHLVGNLLRAEGLLVYLKGEPLHSAIGEVPVDVVRMEVQVARDQFARARRIIEAYERGERRRDPDRLFDERD